MIVFHSRIFIPVLTIVFITVVFVFLQALIIQDPIVLEFCIFGVNFQTIIIDQLVLHFLHGVARECGTLG